MNLPRVPHDFVIKHSTAGTYFKKVMNNKPVFGAACDMQRFASEEEARGALNNFPTVARAMCDIVPWRKP